MSLPAEEPSIRSNARRAYLIMRERIIRNEVPAGQKLHIAAFADELNVSPGAMREALSRLSAENLVLAKDQRGFSVPPLSVDELIDLTQVRIEIESSALERSMHNAGPAFHRDVRRTFKDLHYGSEPFAQSSAAHAAFHEALVSQCGSPTLLRLRASLYLSSERYRHFALHKARSKRDADGEHRAIRDAVLQGDIDSAKAYLADHIGRTSMFVQEALADQSLLPASTSSSRSRKRDL